MEGLNFKVRTGMMIGKATIYGTQWCPHCRHQKEAFKEAHIPYIFVDCEKSPGKCKGITSFPVVRDYPKKGDEWVGYKSLKGFLQGPARTESALMQPEGSNHWR